MSYSPHTFLRSDTTPLGNWWWTMDRWLLGTVFALITLGVLLSFGTSPAAAARLHYSDAFHFAVRQSLFGALAVGLVIGVSMLPARTIRRVAFFVYLAMILVMAALPFIGHEAKGATRWVHFAGFTLQPSEFMKPALIVLVRIAEIAHRAEQDRIAFAGGLQRGFDFLAAEPDPAREVHGEFDFF